MSPNIIIIEKPEWVSWVEIHDVLSIAHADNRSKGIVMRKPTLSGVEIEKELGENGKMFVALDDKKIVGTGAIIAKEGASWYNRGTYGYLCFASVLPNYAGQGIYKLLLHERERCARDMGFETICFDTHEKNKHIIEINKKFGYSPISIKVCKDHFNIIFVKWLKKSPHSPFYCRIRYLLIVLFTRMRFRVDRRSGLMKRTF